MKFQLLESINDKGLFKAVFMAGIPFAGKSTISALTIPGDIQPRIVNTDKFVEYFMKKGEPRRFQKSATLTREQLFDFVNGMLPLMIDSTSTYTESTVRRAGLLESLGYDCAMVYVNVSLETSLARKQSKVRARDVDEDFIRKAAESAEDNKEYYRRRFEVFEEIDNDGPIDQQTVDRVYKTMMKFYNSPVENPNGRRHLKNISNHGEKYLTGGEHPEFKPSSLERVIGSWYKQV